MLRSPPTTDETIEEQPIDVVPIPESTLERLRLAWDADGVADWPAAGALAEISEIAYLPPNEADTNYRELGFTEIMPIVQGSMIGYVISGEDVTVIAFRGTDFGEISDWLANLGTTAMQTSHGSIHRGFYAAYDSMKVQVDSILQARDAKHLWVTGHSLGGALALVCAYDLVETEQRALDGVITFGQPMVASQPFAKYIDTLLVGTIRSLCQS